MIEITDMAVDEVDELLSLKYNINLDPDELDMIRDVIDEILDKREQQEDE